MSGLRLGQLYSDMRTIFSRHGLSAGADFLALGIGMLTLEALLFPTRFVVRRLPDEDTSIASALLDPFLLLHEALFACLFGQACLRIAADMGFGRADEAASLLRRNLLPLIVLNIAIGYASYLGILMLILPGLLLAAVTTTLTPAILIEDRGWQGLTRSVSQCMPHVLRLTGVWAMIYLPALVLLISLTPRPTAETSAGQLWAALIVAEILSVLLATIILALVMATWQQVRDGSDRDRLSDIFH